MKLLIGKAGVVGALIALLVTACSSSDSSRTANEQTSEQQTESTASTVSPETEATELLSETSTTVMPASTSTTVPFRTTEVVCLEEGSATPNLGRAPLSGCREDVPSALANPRNPDLQALVDPAGIRRGVPRPEDIPTIDNPSFRSTSEVEALVEAEPVVAVAINGDARAYPIRVLTRHELVNDTVGGVPVTVSYCPLCNSAVTYDRRVADRVLDFGTSGSLYQSSLVMYDRQTQSLWTHFDGKAVIGHLARAQLNFYPTQIIAWSEWSQDNPEGQVLVGEEGGLALDAYGRNPYVGYETSTNLLSPGFQSEAIDERLPRKERVIGLRTAEGEAVAIRHSHLREAQVVELTFNGLPLVVWNLPGTTSAIDTRVVYEGQDVGTTGVFSALIGDIALTFEPAEGGFRDRETGTLWSVTGKATEGTFEGTQLTPQEFLDTFWFAWSTFNKSTTIIPSDQ